MTFVASWGSVCGRWIESDKHDSSNLDRNLGLIFILNSKPCVSTRREWGKRMFDWVCVRMHMTSIRSVFANIWDRLSIDLSSTPAPIHAGADQAFVALNAIGDVASGAPRRMSS